MTESEFVDLLSRFEKGECTPEEAELLKKWFDTDNLHGTPFRDDAEKGAILAVLRASIYEKAGLSKVSPTRRLTTSFIMKLAASVLAVAIVSYGIYRYSDRSMVEPQSFLTTDSVNEIKKIHLPDGSLVWLKNNSTLVYPTVFDDDERRVTLYGEALFEVEKDPGHPFVITCGDLTTTVLGTSFNIRSTQDEIEVVVLTGEVSLTSATDPTGIVLRPEEKAVYKKALGSLGKVETVADDTRNMADGTEYNMNFEDTRLQDVLRRIEVKFDVTVTLSNPLLGNCLITADFTDQSLQKTLEVISTIISVEYRFTNDTVVLTGEGCD